MMDAPAAPAETRSPILERLIGATGEPSQVKAAARSVGERAVPAIMQALAEKFAIDVTVELQGVELVRYTDARPTVTNHAMSVTPSAISPDALALTIDAEAVALIVSLLFGGDPAAPVAPIERPLSPLELDVVTQVFEQIAQAVNGSGERSFNLKLPVPQAISGVEMAKHRLRDGPAVRITLGIVTPGARGTINLIMPQRVLLKYRGGAGTPSGETIPGDDWRMRFSQEVMRSTVTLEATMPLSRMTLGQLAQLRPGQVIEIEQSAQANAQLSARDRTLFVCEFGKLGQNYTVRIRHPYDAGQDFMDSLSAG